MSKQQSEALERVKHLLRAYREVSPEHADPSINQSVIAGDMIADIQYVMSDVYQYPRGDVESVRIAALNSLRYPV